MTKDINEKVVTLSVRFNQASSLSRPIKVGDRFNLTINGEYYPSCVESIFSDSGNSIFQLKAIVHPHFSGLPPRQKLELREGPNILASCELISVDSVA